MLDLCEQRLRHCASDRRLERIEARALIKQNELYAAIVPSSFGAVASVACSAVPGIGVLIAGTCGGVGGAVDSSVNVSRAKTAEATVRPIKDAILDTNFDEQLRQAFDDSLASAIQASAVTVGKA